MTGYVEQGHEQSDEDRGAREVVELLQELRIVLPGVQVLFAFLLTVPFAARFAELTDAQRYVFFATLLCTAAATALLIAPTAQHRLLFRQCAREHRIKTGNVLTILGLAFLGPAMVGVVYVITDLMFGIVWAVAVTAVMAASFAGLWFGLPLVYPWGETRVRYGALGRRGDEGRVLGHDACGVARLGLPPFPQAGVQVPGGQVDRERSVLD